MPLNKRATHRTRARYQRLAPLYDLMEILPERRYRAWRQRLWAQVQGPHVLELGVGTGKNLPYYPPDVSVTGIDLTPGMLQRAQRQAARLGVDVALQVGDAQQLDFADGTFDEVVATFVFCSVPDPVLGLREAARVLKPGGRLLLLEHMRSSNPVLARLMDLFNPLVVRLSGANINRRTVENVRRSGLQLARVEELSPGGVFKLIVAQRQSQL